MSLKTKIFIILSVLFLGISSVKSVDTPSQISNNQDSITQSNDNKRKINDQKEYLKALEILETNRKFETEFRRRPALSIQELVERNKLDSLESKFRDFTNRLLNRCKLPQLLDTEYTEQLTIYKKDLDEIISFIKYMKNRREKEVRTQDLSVIQINRQEVNKRWIFEQNIMTLEHFPKDPIAYKQRVVEQETLKKIMDNLENKINYLASWNMKGKQFNEEFFNYKNDILQDFGRFDTIVKQIHQRREQERLIEVQQFGKIKQYFDELKRIEFNQRNKEAASKNIASTMQHKQDVIYENGLDLAIQLNMKNMEKLFANYNNFVHKDYVQQKLLVMQNLELLEKHMKDVQQRSKIEQQQQFKYESQRG